MKFGKLPSGANEEKILADLNLPDGEELLFVCQATETFNNGKNGPIGVFAFTDGGIYWLDAKGLHRSLGKDQIWGVFAGKHMCLVVTESTKWTLTKFDKEDSKFLISFMHNYFPEMELPAYRQEKVIVPQSSLEEYTEFISEIIDDAEIDSSGGWAEAFGSFLGGLMALVGIGAVVVVAVYLIFKGGSWLFSEFVGLFSGLGGDFKIRDDFGDDGFLCVQNRVSRACIEKP
jgi:hypothetical protein